MTDYECPECGSAVDNEGYAMDEDAGGCGWTHPDDCDICGAICCDQSC